MFARDVISQRAFGIVFKQNPVAVALDAIGYPRHAAQAGVDFFFGGEVLEVEGVVWVWFNASVWLGCSEETGDFQDLVGVSLTDDEAVAAAADEAVRENSTAGGKEDAGHIFRCSLLSIGDWLIM